MEGIKMNAWFDPCQSEGDACACVSIKHKDIAKILLDYEREMNTILVKKSKDPNIWKNLGRELVSADQYDIWTNGVSEKSNAESFMTIICLLTKSFNEGILENTNRIESDKRIYIPIFKDEYKPIDRFIDPLMDLMKRDDIKYVSFLDEGIYSAPIEKASDFILDVINNSKKMTYLELREFILSNGFYRSFR